MGYEELKRGGVWILVGIGLFIYGAVEKTSFLVRGTHIPFGAIVIVIGAGLVVWDVAKARRTK